MRNLKTQLAALLLSTVCLLTGASAQITPSADAYTNTADPSTNYGAATLLYVNGAWAEGTITSSTAPALGNTIAASVPLTTADKNQYILIDITPAVQAWLNGTANGGVALGNSPLNASFDSNENHKSLKENQNENDN